MAGLWALSVGGDFAQVDAADLGSFYATGVISGPGKRIQPGFYLQGRKHVSDSFFGVLALASLSKNYEVDTATARDLYQWETIQLSAGAGWVLYRALHSALFLQAEAGWLGLNEGTFTRNGTAATRGVFEGSAISTQFTGGGLWFLMPSVALELSGGYRSARLPLQFSTASGQQNPSFAPQFYADFSGPFGRFGLSFFWGLRNPWGNNEAPPPPSEGPPTDE